jgi:hypothetical protein
MNSYSDIRKLFCRSIGQNRVTFMVPQPEQIDPDDILFHLSQLCRYCGGIKWFSVAEHSFIGSYRADNLRIAREFLIHDFNEYCFGDPPSPTLKAFPDYRQHAHEFQRALNLHFLGYEDLSPEVKIIDNQMCADEQFWIRGIPDEYLNMPHSMNFQAFHMPPSRMYREITLRFLELFPELSYREFLKYKELMVF